MINKLKRNPLLVFSLIYSWILSKVCVDQTSRDWPIIINHPFMSLKIIKKRGAKITINGRLIVEKRGCPGAFSGPTLEVLEDAELVINNTVIIGPNSHFIVGRGGKLVFGDADDTSTQFSYSSKIVADEYVKIGSGGLFSWDILIIDTSTHKIDGSVIQRPVIFEKYVWVGARATILKGVTIGEGSIIATGAVVTKSVPPNSIVGGNPATVLRTNVSWEL